jgi:hypothetical protein
MSDTINVHLTLTRDKPDTMDFRDTYAGLKDVWYKFEVDPTGNVIYSLQPTDSNILRDTS